MVIRMSSLHPVKKKLGDRREWTVAGRVVTPDGVLEAGYVQIRDGRIQAVGRRDECQRNIDIDVGELLVGPGFIDIHVHGAAGKHFMTADDGGIFEILRFHMLHGTTSLLATTTTAERDGLTRTLQTIGRLMLENQIYDGTMKATIQGVHLEGPYFNPLRAGAQNPKALRLPDLEEYQELERIGTPIRMVTLAPELSGSEHLIRYLQDQGVRVSAGHTNATYEELEAALEWGVAHFTHFTNAMSGFSVREPGVFEPGAVVAGLLHDEATVEVIADGVHVHPKILELIVRMKGADRVALITDAVPLCGLPDGIYDNVRIDGQHLVVSKGVVRLRNNAVLAGSALTMNRAVKMMSMLGLPLADVWRMASQVPAEIIGLGDRKGMIHPGYDADLIIVDNEFAVKGVIIDGQYERILK